MAMTQQEYEDRIAKSEEKLAKIEKRIQKWEENKSDAKFAKQYDWMQADDNSWLLGWNDNKRVYGTFDEFKQKKYAEWEHECNREIQSAQREKDDTLTTIQKYKNSIALLQEKDAKPVIKIFRDFFDSWKEEIMEYVKPLVDEYYETNKKSSHMFNNRFRVEELGFATWEEFDAEYKRLRLREKELQNEPIVRTAIEKGLHRSDATFRKYLDDYMNQRYYELVDKVTEIVGDINDVSNLTVGVDGTLNGRIYGDKGGAKIETIVAGGYNTDVVVNVKHGQIRHYRVLVHPIKE